MGEALLGGSAIAAFLAGIVAFFAPCCAGVMLPSYLATTVGAGRRLVPVTGLYVAGVATVVWPLTIGAAGLASLINRYHAALFVAGAALMVVLGIATIRGWMWSLPLPQAPTGTGAAGAYTLGVFSGAATACCAPVLAGAVAIAGVSASWWVGALMGGVYLLGMITPLIAAAAGIQRIRPRLRDPAVTIAVAGRVLRTTRLRLAAGVTFLMVGALLMALVATGQADRAPGPQADVARWLDERASRLAEAMPLALGWVLVAGFAFFVIVAALRSRARHGFQEGSP